MSVNSKMTAIANGLRKLLGLFGTMGLDDMANNISTAQNEVDAQNSLIAQINSILNGKAGGIVPQGIFSITKNGTYDVTQFANAQVNVPVGVFPEGKKQITSNGTHDITQYASAEVSVPVPSGYIKPSGTADITTNGTHNVSQYKYANVDVSPTLQDKTVTPSTSNLIVRADPGYKGLGVVTVEAMPTVTQATPGITVSAAGLITASAAQTEGYVSAGTKSATKQLTTQAAQTITPGTSNKTIDSGRYLTGTQTIKGDSNLVAANIKKGVSIFGVPGDYEGEPMQTQTGTFELNLYASAEVVCGFKPDCVVIYSDQIDEMTVCTGAMFSLAGSDFVTILVPSPNTLYNYVNLPMQREEYGFRVTNAWYHKDGEHAKYTTFNYVALKFY